MTNQFTEYPSGRNHCIYATIILFINPMFRITDSVQGSSTSPLLETVEGDRSGQRNKRAKVDLMDVLDDESDEGKEEE